MREEMTVTSPFFPTKMTKVHVRVPANNKLSIEPALALLSYKLKFWLLQ